MIIRRVATGKMSARTRVKPLEGKPQKRVRYRTYLFLGFQNNKRAREMPNE